MHADLGGAPSSGHADQGTTLHVSNEATVALRTLYRRLLKSGEEGAMMQHTLSTHTLEEAVGYGTKLLRTHRMLTQVDTQAQQLSAWRHPLKRLNLACQRRRCAWSLFWLRLRLRSKNAVSDALVYILFVVTCALLYSIYYACRVGVNRAEERYRTLAIPVLQTFEALEIMEERKKRMKKEMEDDILRQRA